MKKRTTSWGGVAKWYDDLLDREGTYQSELILPNLIRLLAPRRGQIMLDLACGQGFFSRAFAAEGVRVIGVDISKELIDIAKKRGDKGVEYHAAPADKIPFVPDSSVDVAVIVLALQNIESVGSVFTEVHRVLKSHGRFAIVLNHPAFRIPKRSSWGWDPSTSSGQVPSKGVTGVQYRRIDGYLSESVEKIQMHPSLRSGPSVRANGDYTLSFHRPIQFYAKAFQKAGFLISRIEEWNSNRKSEPGPRAKAENLARREIPMFLYVEAMKAAA